MNDSGIVELYWARSEAAIEETSKKYGAYCYTVAYNILSNREDSEEAVNDTYLSAWNSMPPNWPNVLHTYLGRITRQLSIDRFRTRNREKRRGSEYALSLTELEECVSAGDTTVQGVRYKQLAQSISEFLRRQTPRARYAFVGRYYYADSIKEIAAYCGMTQSGVKSLLHRTRLALRDCLEQEGIL